MKKYEVVKVNPVCIAKLHIGNYLIEAKNIINNWLKDITKGEWSISEHSTFYICRANTAPSLFTVIIGKDGWISVYERPISEYCIKEV